MARLLLGVHIGLRVLARTRPERPLLEGMVRPALALLDSHDTGKATARRTSRKP
jgi:TetR/AcrR family transcriptional repressor of nem operon